MKRIALLTAAMLMAGVAAAGEMSSKDKIKMMDTNGDGMLSAAEHAAGAQKMFMDMDTNKDGMVNAAEMDAAWMKMSKMHDKMMKDGMHDMHKDGKMK